MSAIFGVFNKSGSKIVAENVDFLQEELDYWNPGNSILKINNNVALGYHMLFTTVDFKNEELPFFDNVSGCSITADARIYYREELLRELGKPKNLIETISDSQLILFAYQKWGTNCVNYLFGEFAFVIMNHQTQELFCGRDHFGCCPLYYYEDNEVFIFSSEIRALLSTLKKEFQISESFIVDCLASIPIEKHKSAYESINRLAPASLIKVRPARTEVEIYWKLEKKSKFEHLSEDEAKSTLLKQLKKSVKERCHSDYPIGVELSGGLDSSALATLVNEVLAADNKKLFTFSHVLESSLKGHVFPFDDESYFSELIVKELGIENHTKVSSSQGKDCCDQIMSFVSQVQRPVWLLYALMSDQLFEKAKASNVRVMLSGFGGDQGASFSGGSIYDELLNNRGRRTLKELVKLWSLEGNRSFFRDQIKHLVYKWAPFLLNCRQYLIWKKKYKHLVFRQRLVEKELCRKYRVNQRLRNKTWIPIQMDISKRQSRMINQNSISERLENTWLLGRKNQIEYRYCLLDVKLIELHYSLPTSLKFKNGYGRYLFRTTMDGILPSEICWRKDKSGSTIPSVYSRVIKDEKTILSLIADAEKHNSFHYINYTVLRDIYTKLKEKGRTTRNGPVQRDVICPLSVLILQKWQREGKIDIGIKC